MCFGIIFHSFALIRLFSLRKLEVVQYFIHISNKGDGGFCIGYVFVYSRSLNRLQFLQIWIKLFLLFVMKRAVVLNELSQMKQVCCLKNNLSQMFLFNNALNTFYLRLYGVRNMVKDHSDTERGNPLLPHRLLFPINSKGSSHRQDSTYHGLCYTSRGEHWLDQEIAQWVHPMKDRSGDP